MYCMGSHVVIIECDENAHSGYDKSKERERERRIAINLGLPTVFIRFNPKDDRRDSGPPFEDRIKTLIEWLDLYCSFTPSMLPPVNEPIVEFLFY